MSPRVRPRARRLAGRAALVVCAALLVGLQGALAQEELGLKAARDVARDAWIAADAALRDTRRVAAAARSEHQIQLRRERALERPAWWVPRFLVDERREEVRREAHEAAARVVEAEHRVSAAEAQERVARLLYVAAASEWVIASGDPAAIRSESAVLDQLGRRMTDLAPPPAPPALDVAALASLSAVQLEALELTFEDLAREAERRRADLEPLRARTAHLVRALERRVLAQAAPGLEAPLANRRAELRQLVAWADVERERATTYRGRVRELEALRERVERRERAARAGGDDRD